MKCAGRVDFRNGKRIVALVGKPPRWAFGADVISLRFQRGKRWCKHDQGVYMTPDEAAWTIVVLGHAMQKLTSKMRSTFARRHGRRLRVPAEMPAQQRAGVSKV